MSDVPDSFSSGQPGFVAGRDGGVADELSARLCALAAAGFTEDPVAGATDGQPRALALRAFVGREQRVVSPEALTVANRILAAAGVRVGADRTVPEVDNDLTVARAPRNRPAPVDVSTTTTVAPFVAIVLGADRTRHEFREGDTLMIGRVPGPGGLAVDHLHISRRQVRLEMRLGSLLATELGSTNGTAVIRNGVARDLERAVAAALQVGDRLVVSGEIVLCTVESLDGTR